MTSSSASAASTLESKRKRRDRERKSSRSSIMKVIVLARKGDFLFARTGNKWKKKLSRFLVAVVGAE